MYELKILRGVMCYDNEKWCKIWIGIDLSVQNWHSGFDEWHWRVLENLKHLHLNGFLLGNVYKVWAKKSTEKVCLMAVNIDAKFEGKLTCAF